MWQWNGHTWELNAAAVAPPKPGFSGARLRGIVVLALLCLAALVVGGVALAGNFQIGAGSCLPSDFPGYPGATVSSEVAYTGTPPQCVMVLHTGDPQETVVQYYQSRLSGGDWRLDSFSDQTGTMTFHRISRPQTGG
jgi:hypothetical protein